MSLRWVGIQTQVSGLTVKRIGNIVLGVLVLFFGAVYGLGAVTTLDEWSAISRAYAAYMLVMAICALMAVICGLWLLATRGKDARPLRFGAFGMAGCGVVIIAGVLAKEIPCGGPT